MVEAKYSKDGVFLHNGLYTDEEVIALMSVEIKYDKREIAELREKLEDRDKKIFEMGIQLTQILEQLRPKR